MPDAKSLGAEVKRSSSSSSWLERKRAYDEEEKEWWDTDGDEADEQPNKAGEVLPSSLAPPPREDKAPLFYQVGLDLNSLMSKVVALVPPGTPGRLDVCSERHVSEVEGALAYALHQRERDPTVLSSLEDKRQHLPWTGTQVLRHMQHLHDASRELGGANTLAHKAKSLTMKRRLLNSLLVSCPLEIAKKLSLECRVEGWMQDLGLAYGEMDPYYVLTLLKRVRHVHVSPIELIMVVMKMVWRPM